MRHFDFEGLCQSLNRLPLRSKCLSAIYSLLHDCSITSAFSWTVYTRHNSNILSCAPWYSPVLWLEARWDFKGSSKMKRSEIVERSCISLDVFQLLTVDSRYRYIYTLWLLQQFIWKYSLPSPYKYLSHVTYIRHVLGVVLSHLVLIHFKSSHLDCLNISRMYCMSACMMTALEHVWNFIR